MRRSTFTELKTKRLLLRKLQASDASEILFLRSDAVVNKYIRRDTPKHRADAQKFISTIIDRINKQNMYYWGIALQGADSIIGTICLWKFSADKKTAEVGYDLHPDAHGKGIMSEAMQAVLDYGFQQLQLNTIEAFTHKSNLSSRHLLVRNGFTLLPKRKDENNEMNCIYIISK